MSPTQRVATYPQPLGGFVTYPCQALQAIGLRPLYTWVGRGVTRIEEQDLDRQALVLGHFPLYADEAARHRQAAANELGERAIVLPGEVAEFLLVGVHGDGTAIATVVGLPKQVKLARHV